MRLGHLNFYMLQGGTSFGFMSGRNGGCKTCDVTSYDYDSPLTMKEIDQNYGFDMYPLPLDEKQIDKLNFDGGCNGNGPAFYRFEFDVEEPADTFLDLDGFGKGGASINGFNLGRFWEIGPQRRLY